MKKLFRRIEARDVDQLFVVRTSVPENAMTMDELARMGITPKSTVDELGDPLVGYLCEASGHIVGFAMADLKSGEFSVIAVLPECERRGVGRELLRLTEDLLWSAGWQSIWLWTGTDRNARAWRLYQSAGWVETELRTDRVYLKKVRSTGAGANVFGCHVRCCRTGRASQRPGSSGTFDQIYQRRKTMSPPSSAEAHPPGEVSSSSLRDVGKDAIRYWESHRVVYNLVLTVVVLAWLVVTWPHFRPAVIGRSGLLLLVLAALANACYCAAYPVDILFQRSPFQAAWKRRRWILWCAGMILAVVLACYWIADEIYPSVG